METVQRRRQLVTPHTRSLIYRAVKIAPHQWHGTRHGVKMRIQIISQRTLDDEAVVWHARINKQWQSGRSQTVRDAIDAIEIEAAK